MVKVTSQDLGVQPINKLLIKQAVPASIGILVMSLNILVDTIFVGNWIGYIAIAAINIVLPVSFFIAALGMAIGIGGSSIISRALGGKLYEKALKTFGNQITLTLLVTVSMAVFGLIFSDALGARPIITRRSSCRRVPNTGVVMRRLKRIPRSVFHRKMM